MARVSEGEIPVQSSMLALSLPSGLNVQCWKAAIQNVSNDFNFLIQLNGHRCNAENGTMSFSKI
jgi:hypothetical protein